MTDITRPLGETAAAIQARRTTAAKAAAASLEAIEATDKTYHAILETNPEAASQAKAIDRRIVAGHRFPLAGVPFIAKDNFLTTATHTTAASHILEPFEAPYEAVAIERLRNAGAVLTAKSNLDAFAHGTSTENSDFGPTKNPHDPTRVPGGSSGGSAAAVALGQAAFAIGTDTGGSIRQPAAFCGIVGLKPTYGLVPRTGVVAMASSADVIGPLTRSVSDAALVLDVLAGRHPSDATSIERDPEGYVSVFPSNLSDLKIGVISQYLSEGLEPAVRRKFDAVVSDMRAAGAHIREISVPATTKALAAYYILVPAEVSSNLARYDGIRYGYSSPHAKNLEQMYKLSREEGFGNEAKRRIMIGTYVLSSGYYDAYYKQAQKVRTTLIDQFNAAFDNFDLLIGPTSPNPAFKLGEKASDPLALYLEDVMTVAVNLVGIPAISLPMAKIDGLPVGMQIMAPQGTERRLLAAAMAVEQMLGDWTRR